MTIKGWIALFLLTLLSCKKKYDAPVPEQKWDLFETASKNTLPASTRNGLEGVYSLTQGAEVFGGLAALKWSYTINDKDTVYHLSMFCEKQVIYIICEGRRLDTSILLKGYWRDMLNTATGAVRLSIASNNGAANLLGIPNQNVAVTMTGMFGNSVATPDRPIRLQYQRPLYSRSQLEIVAHRGGGRTSDLLPASENTVEMIKLASRLGATGIEIDVRLTKDGIPIIYHDETLNERLIQKNGMIGPIENYTYDQLSSLVRLSGGEKIPTLRQALDSVVYATPLRYVWLDTKFKGNIKIERDIQLEYLEKAAAISRQLTIHIGIPDKDVLDNFQRLPDYQKIPSVCELTPEDVAKVDAKIWAPRWTLGLQVDEVEKMHAAGRKAFVWTLDVPDNINKYFTQGRFDGILSNYPSSVAYYYYAKQ